VDVKLAQLWRDFLANNCSSQEVGRHFLRAGALIDPENLLTMELKTTKKEETVSAVISYYPLLAKNSHIPWECQLQESVNSAWQRWIDETPRQNNILDSWQSCRSPESMLHLIHRNDVNSYRLLLVSQLLLKNFIQHSRSTEDTQIARWGSYAMFDSLDALVNNHFYCFVLNQSSKPWLGQASLEQSNIIRDVIPFPTKDPNYFRQPIILRK